MANTLGYAYTDGSDTKYKELYDPATPTTYGTVAVQPFWTENWSDGDKFYTKLGEKTITKSINTGVKDEITITQQCYLKNVSIAEKTNFYEIKMDEIDSYDEDDILTSYGNGTFYYCDENGEDAPVDTSDIETISISDTVNVDFTYSPLNMVKVTFALDNSDSYTWYTPDVKKKYEETGINLVLNTTGYNSLVEKGIYYYREGNNEAYDINSFKIIAQMYSKKITSTSNISNTSNYHKITLDDDLKNMIIEAYGSEGKNTWLSEIPSTAQALDYTFSDTYYITTVYERQENEQRIVTEEKEVTKEEQITEYLVYPKTPFVITQQSLLYNFSENDFSKEDITDEEINSRSAAAVIELRSIFSKDSDFNFDINSNNGKLTWPKISYDKKGRITNVENKSGYLGINDALIVNDSGAVSYTSSTCIPTAQNIAEAINDAKQNSSNVICVEGINKENVDSIDITSIDSESNIEIIINTGTAFSETS